MKKPPPPPPLPNSITIAVHNREVPRKGDQEFEVGHIGKVRLDAEESVSEQLAAEIRSQAMANPVIMETLAKKLQGAIVRYLSSPKFESRVVSIMEDAMDTYLRVELADDSSAFGTKVREYVRAGFEENVNTLAQNILVGALLTVRNDFLAGMNAVIKARQPGSQEIVEPAPPVGAPVPEGENQFSPPPAEKKEPPP